MTLKNRPYCLVAAAFWFVLAGFGVAGFYDIKRHGVTDTAPGWLYTAACIIVAVRALRLGIAVRDDRVIIRSWLRSRMVGRDDVLGAHAVAYDGALTPGTSTFLVMPRLLMRAGDPIDGPAVIGLRRTGRIQRLTQRLTDAVTWTG